MYIRPYLYTRGALQVVSSPVLHQQLERLAGLLLPALQTGYGRLVLRPLRQLWLRPVPIFLEWQEPPFHDLVSPRIACAPEIRRVKFHRGPCLPLLKELLIDP